MKRFRAKKRHLNGTDSPPAPANEENETSDIPGYYYDAEKKRYFKILKNENNTSSILTRSLVDSKRNEEKRRAAIREFDKATRHSDKNVLHSLRNRHLANCEWNSRVFQEKMEEKSLIQIRSVLKSRVFEVAENTYQLLHCPSFFIPTNKATTIVGVWHLKSLLIQRIQCFDLKLNRNNGIWNFDLLRHGESLLHTARISDLCLAGNPEENCLKVLYVVYCPMLSLQRPTTAYLQDLNSDPNGGCEYVLGRQLARSCAWNTLQHMFSVGFERSAAVVDAETRKMWELNTHNSEVICQCFQPHSMHILMSSTLRKTVMMHDLRSSSTIAATELRHDHTASGMRFLKDTCVLCTCDLVGNIYRWDLRMQKPVWQVPTGRGKSKKCSLFANETENFLYCVDDDCFTRFWSVQNGELLFTIPPPYPVTPETVPLCVYSERWQRDPLYRGLLMAVKDELHFYSHPPTVDDY